METLPLHFAQRHLFMEIEGNFWLFDTGAPISFGECASLRFGGRTFPLAGSYLGLSAQSLSDLVGIRCAGILGADILNKFDFLIDVPNGRITYSEEPLEHPGATVACSQVMGVPVVTAQVDGSAHDMFFDTGAQISYLQDSSTTRFPPAGTFRDFYPLIGTFETETHFVPLTVGGLSFTLRCGRLPGLLAAALLLAGTTGILGNEILAHRKAGYFPRRSCLVL